MNSHTASDSSRTKVYLMIGLGLLVFGFLVSKLLGGGGGTEQVQAISGPVTAGAPETGAPATPEAAAAPAAPAVETFEVFTTKNPFVALRTAAATSSSAKPTAAAPAAPAPAAPAAPAPAAPVPASTTATGGQATEPVRTTKVALLDVFAEGDRVVANVRVNDTVSKVGAGDPFANNFKVVSLDQSTRCGRFLYGDDSFRMCRGEELLK